MQVDWELAERIARAAAGEAPAFVAPARLEEHARMAERQVVEATGLTPRRPLPPVEWVGRGEWIAANLATMRSLLQPALDRAAGRGGGRLLAGVGGTLMAVEIGALLGLFSRRVLGQYEVDLVNAEREPRLLLVAPNLDHAARAMGVDRESFIAWVTLHEVTHAVQFSAVPWLRGHLGDALEELLKTLDVKPDPRALLKRIDLADVRALADQVRDRGLLGLMLDDRRRALLERVQGTMGLVEGHAEWAMDKAAVGVLPDVEELRRKLDRRRTERAPLLKILDRLLGMELKLRQYTQGREFCDAVEAARGPEGLRDAWASPELMPMPDELADPQAWLERTAS